MLSKLHCFNSKLIYCKHFLIWYALAENVFPDSNIDLVNSL